MLFPTLSLAAVFSSLLMMSSMSPTITDRASPSKIRRAAGSKDPSVLPKAVLGWTCQELDDMATQDGKNALHMAAWQGCIENVRFLVKEIGCNVNVISTGEFSFGKTPIFFAATRCRNDVVQYLLAETDAHVKIVNNKGQSVLSIASSHLNPETIAMIQRAEEAQRDMEWKNYRATHSDGLEYGDLDPRFVDRTLRPTDVVTPLAVNPTTKQSRRGSFARKNPHRAKEIQRRQEKKQQRQRQQAKPARPMPTQKELEQQEDVWKSIESCIAQQDHGSIGQWLLQVVRFEEGQRRLWIPQATARLQTILVQSGNDMVATKLEDAMMDMFTNASENKSTDCTMREVALLQKWIHQVCKAPTLEDDERPEALDQTVVYHKQARTSINPIPLVNLSVPPWVDACDAVRGLSQSLLQNPSRHDSHLSLPEAPTLVDTEEALVTLTETLRDFTSLPNPCVIALDTEWYTDVVTGETHVSTIQISTIVESGDETAKTIQTWLVDLLEDSNSYQEMVQELLLWLFDDDPHVILLGFAFAHDVHMLRTSVCSSLSSSKCLDIQRLAMQDMKRGRKTVPGLQACAAQYLSQNGSYILSKEEQCSDWARRPLRDVQIEYAGLDAAVLLVLLAEIAKGIEKEDIDR